MHTQPVRLSFAPRAGRVTTQITHLGRRGPLFKHNLFDEGYLAGFVDGDFLGDDNRQGFFFGHNQFSGRYRRCSLSLRSWFR